MEFSRFPATLQSRAGWSRFFEAKRTEEPHVHQIEPTNHCPYTCIMCPRSTQMHRPLGFMDMDLFRSIIDEISGYAEPVRSKEIELFHFGESLLHPEIDGMVAYAASRKLNVSLSVNAPQLTPDVAARILDAGLFRLIVSLDGYDQESYQNIRGAAADYRLATENLQRLIAISRNISPAPRICLRIIQLNANQAHLELFRREWEAQGIEVEVRSFFPWSEKDMAALGVVEKYPAGMPCPFPWEYLVVQWDGSVVPCCRDYNGVNALGNVRNESLKAIWNSDRYAAFREQHQSGGYGSNDFCRECMEIYYTAPDVPVDDSECPGIPAAGDETLADLWQRAAEKFADRPLIIDDTDSSRFSYADADDVVIRVMGSLNRAGLQKGDRLAVCAPQHAESAFLFWAAMRLGLVFVPLDPRLPHGVLKDVLDEVAPALLFCDADSFNDLALLTAAPLVVLDDVADVSITGAPRFADWLTEDNPAPAHSAVVASDPAVILFTSGTSGRHKGVILSQGALYRSSALMAASYGWKSDDVLASMGEFHTMSGLRNLCLATLHSGAAFLVSAPEKRANALLAADLLSRQGATILATVPAMIRQLLAAADRLGASSLAGLRQVLCTGSSLSPENYRDFRLRFHLPLYNYYGLTETAGLCIGMLPHRSSDPASIGFPLGAQVRIAKPDGSPLPAGAVGELLIRSPNLMIGYLGDPEDSETVLRDGWYGTGDVARRDENGAIYLAGRSGDAIKDRRGEFIHPIEIEQALEGHPHVAEAGVCGVTGCDGEECLIAAIVPSVLSTDPLALLRELRQLVFEKLGSTRLPARFQLVDTLPRGNGGKLLRKQLAAQLATVELNA